MTANSYCSVENIRDDFGEKLVNNDFVIDKSGVKTIELIGVSFLADSPSIFGKVNEDYIERELEWYKSKSLFVKDIPGKTPVIWNQVSSIKGEINSNYGWCIWSPDNYHQFENCFKELIHNPDSRRAIMIYTRPKMHLDYNRDGMSDFMCTNNVQYVIRDNHVNAIVNMRSNDAWAGYRNDWAWQKYVLEQLTESLNNKTKNTYQVGDIIWNVGSIHVYENQFYLVDNYNNSGKHHIDKKDYTGIWK